jgi:hypothetical protein
MNHGCASNTICYPYSVFVKILCMIVVSTIGTSRSEVCSWKREETQANCNCVPCDSSGILVSTREEWEGRCYIMIIINI